MDNNALKLWFQENLNKVAIKQVQSELDRRGKALPCRVVSITGQLVTVAFEVENDPVPLPNITIPKAEGPWIISPTQVGDVGMTVPSQAYLDGISGMGPGTATMRRMSNLSALVWVPVARKSTVPPVQNAATVQGPQGAVIQTTSGTTSSVVTNQSGTTVTFGGNTVVVDSSTITLTVGSTSLTVEDGQITMTAGGQTISLSSSGMDIGGIVFETHKHTGVTTGSSDTGGPVS